jgi:dTDP-4-dehydrorhamnose 3,5-epimerase
MPFIKTDIPDLLIYEPRVFHDTRGYFFESYNRNTFAAEGVTHVFVQDNQARSSYGVIRGLHFQHEPNAQTKLVRALSGNIRDVVVDLRKGSPTYGKSFSIDLSAENKRQLLVPIGFAHGYAVLSPSAEVMYKCDNFYNKESEGGLLFNDPALGIDWGIPADQAIVAEKDLLNPTLAECGHQFVYRS